jgi:hypothetical protein
MINSIGLERQSTGSTIWLREWTQRVQRFASSTMCVLMGGHWRVYHVERERVCLRCVACGNSTPGWEVGRRRA